MRFSRRDFLRSATATALWVDAPADLFAQTAAIPAPLDGWDNGLVRHLLPTVSDTRILIKASFNAPLPRRQRCASAEPR